MSKDDIIYESTTPSRRAELDRQRRTQDQVSDLPNGFTLKPHGRDGVVYYREDERVLELPYEADGTRAGILLYIDGLEAWALPGAEPTSSEDRERIRSALDEWLHQHRGAVTLVSRKDLIRPWESQEP